MSRRKATFPDVAGPMDSARSDYNAARESRYRRRRTGVNPQGSGADYHYRSEADWLKILEQARDFDRNDMVIGQTVDRAVTNTIQDGMTLDPKTGSDDLDDHLEGLWNDWSEDPDECDVSGEMTFADYEQMAFRSMLVDGDVAVLPLEEGQMQAIEAHRIRTPPGKGDLNVIHGVQVDEFRKRIAYFLTKDDAASTKRFKAADFLAPVMARNGDGDRQVFHVYNPKRFSQTRGISAFAPIFDPVGMFEDIQFASLIKQAVVSSFAIFREREIGYDGGTAAQTGTRTDTARTDGTTQTVEGIGPGMQITGNPGEKLHGFSPNVPGDSFFDHSRLILTIIGINLGLPLVLVLMDASETNFSGYRGALDQARLGFRRNQKALIRKFHKPCYLWKVRQWIQDADDSMLRGVAERTDVKVFEHKWNTPRWPYIEPTKDATGDTIKLNGNLASPRTVQGDRGGNWFETIDETVEDWGYAVKVAMKAAKEINAEVGGEDPVAWRELLRWTSSIAVNVDAREDAPEPRGKESK